MTVGNGRGAFIGDTLGNVLRAAGYDVTKEYYFNDAGAQIDRLGRSMEHYLWRAAGDEARANAALAAIPIDEKGRKEGYYGPYYEALAHSLLVARGRALLEAPEASRAALIGAATAALIMENIRDTMRRMRVRVRRLVQPGFPGVLR